MLSGVAGIHSTIGIYDELLNNYSSYNTNGNAESALGEKAIKKPTKVKKAAAIPSYP